MKKHIRKWKWLGLGIVGVFLLGLFLRVYNLTILPVFVDEAIYVRWAQVMAWEPTLRFLPLSDGKQPFYMWVLMFLIKHFSDPLFIGRLVSVFTGLGTMFGIFTLSYLLFKNKVVSLFSALLYSISPFTVFFDRMALVDSMLSMFGVWVAVFGYLTVKYKRLDFALITGFCLGFATLTKSSAIFSALLLPSFWLLTSWPKNKKKFGMQFLKLGVLSLVSYVLAYFMYNIQRLGPNFALLTSRTKDYVLPISHIWTNPFDPLIPYLKDFVVWLWTMGPFMIIPILLFGMFFGFKKHFKETLVVSLWFFAPVIIQAELARAFTARYIFFTLPYLFILSGMFLLQRNKLFKKAALVVIAIFAVQALIFDYHLLTNPESANLPRGERSGYLEEWTAGQGIKQVADYIRAEHIKDPDTQIVVGTEGYFGTLPDGLQIYVNDISKIIVIGVGVIIEDVPNSLMEAKEAGNKTYLVINKSRFKGDPEKQGYKLIASYPKALRLTDSKQFAQYGPFEELFFFELIK
ncbi:glycosyltransferase family 39 protein [Candidatus Microgenomates bacterium]|nr:glycosyltransferase family 39 protein [Candidatus Microgenomates bacterium]